MRRIFLIGYMGSGKTTFGRLIAKSQNMSFVDLDIFIEEKYLKSIIALFEEVGEAQFRKIERDALREVSQFENCLIATGGGTPCFFDNMEYMNSMGDTIYLRTSVSELCARLKMSRTKRPLLSKQTEGDLKSNISKMLETREPCYMLAKFILDTDDLNPNNLVSSFDAIYEV
ncbi:MAG: shikimate kinase [Bacteroidales bacterium]|nr:shikimate kinase [Bacteroidales bacterium]